MVRKCIALVIVAFLIGGCDGGIKFAQLPVNVTLPEAFASRATYPGGVAGYNFKDLVGNVLLVDETDSPLLIGVLRPNGYKDSVKLITDPLNYYKSKIQFGAQAQGSYLAFAAGFKADQLAEVTLFDVAWAGINFGEGSTFPDIQQKIVTWVREHPKGPQDSTGQRLWIKSAVLTKKLVQSYVKIDMNASGQLAVVGVKTGVYAESGDEVREVIIAIEAFDMDKFVGTVSLLPAAHGPEVLLPARHLRPITRPIKIQP